MRSKVFHIFVYCIVQTVCTPGRLCYSRRFNVEKVPPTVGVRMQYIEIIRKWRCKYRTIKKIFGPSPRHSIHTFTPVVPLHLDTLKIFRTLPAKVWAHFHANQCVIFPVHSDTVHVSLQALQFPLSIIPPILHTHILFIYHPLCIILAIDSVVK